MFLGFQRKDSRLVTIHRRRIGMRTTDIFVRLFLPVVEAALLLLGGRFFNLA